MATSTAAVIIGFYLLPFLLDVANINAGKAGLVLLISKLWDAVTDPMMGRISDNTRTRWGRRRPYLLFGAIPFGVAYFFLWQVPHLSETGLFIYYLGMLCLLNTMFTVVGVPYVSMMPEITEDYHQRTILTGFKTSFQLLATLLAGIAHGVIIGAIDDQKKAYMVSAAIHGTFITIPPLIVFTFTREKPQEEGKGRLSYWQGVRIALKNKPFVVICFIYLFDWMAITFIQSNFYLYVQYNLRAKDQFAALITVVQAFTLGCIPLWAILSKKHGKKKVFILGIGVLVFIVLSLFFITDWHPYIMFPVAAAAGFGVSAGYLLPWSMVPDCIDADELETGERREGVFYGLFVFLQKFGLSVALAMAGFSLDSAGFENPKMNPDTGKRESQEQPDSAIIALRILIGIVPAVLLAISIVFATFYPITRMRQRATIWRLKRLRQSKGQSDTSTTPTEEKDIMYNDENDTMLALEDLRVDYFA
eukprot:TRINITY_DN21430_c0_g1_i1.p1 TRINITY_DN21430_c0_g1~~TRINITY_DN21430_c0_g1_i1.p1  ORF type:complete len:539 (+),score=103.63 TRINITY_DN21430_c0_g1_i1:192-1619(+)